MDKHVRGVNKSQEVEFAPRSFDYSLPTRFPCRLGCRCRRCDSGLVLGIDQDFIDQPVFLGLKGSQVAIPSGILGNHFDRLSGVL